MIQGCQSIQGIRVDTLTKEGGGVRKPGHGCSRDVLYASLITLDIHGGHGSLDGVLGLPSQIRDEKHLLTKKRRYTWCLSVQTSP